jgi:hypothetical protein
MFLHEKADWVDGVYTYNSELIEGKRCGLNSFKLTEKQQEVYNVQQSFCKPRDGYTVKG